MIRLPALALALALTVAGCSSDSSTAGGSILGTYSLRSIDGKNLPWSQLSGSTTFTVSSGTLVLAGDLTYSLSVPEQNTTNGVTGSATTTQTGTYSISGTSILFTPANIVPGATGTLTNSTIVNGTISVAITYFGQCAFSK